MHRFGLLLLVLASCTVDAPHGSVKAKEVAPPAKIVVDSPPTKTVADSPSVPEQRDAPVPEPGDPGFDVLPRVAPAADAIVIVDPGTEPRRVLALGGRKGDTRTLKLGLEMKVAMDLGEKKVPPTTVPPLAVTVRAEITEANADGVAIALAVSEVTADAPEGTTARVRDALTRTADRLRGTTGTMRIAKDGRVLAFDLASKVTDAKPTAPALEPELGGLTAALQELLPAVPSEPVGDGARWTSIRHVRRDARDSSKRARGRSRSKATP